MPLYRKYIERPRKLILNPSNNTNYLQLYFENIREKYHINEFDKRYKHKIFNFLKKHSYDFVTSKHIGIKDIPFICFNTVNYGYGFKGILYYPIIKFSITKKTMKHEIHDPIKIDFVPFEAPYEIVIKHLEGNMVLVGYTAACFIYGLEYLFDRRISFLTKTGPKNLMRRYENLRDKFYSPIEAEKILSYIRIFNP